MTGYAVDASIVVKWLVKEEFSDEASSLLEGETMLIAPEPPFAEPSTVLWAMRQRGDIGCEDLADATDVLRASPIAISRSIRQLAAAATRHTLSPKALRQSDWERGTKQPSTIR